MLVYFRFQNILYGRVSVQAGEVSRKSVALLVFEADDNTFPEHTGNCTEHT